VKILLTGSNGLLGQAIRQVATERGHCSTPSSGFSLNWHDNSANAEQFREVDVVIHAAANTDVEKCERLPDFCYRDNTLLSEHVARLTARAGKKFVFISSTGIYGDHKSTPYSEFDAAEPCTHHHRSKLLAEQSVLRISPESLIIRTGWLFGGNADLPKNFVARRIEEANQSVAGTISSTTDQFGNPCYNIDIARRLMELIERDMFGIFNCVNSGFASRYEYVKSILEFAGLSTIVLPCSASHFERIAKVSSNEAAVNWKAEMMGFDKMPAWQLSLENYIKTFLLRDGALASN
jgi:dTDP-4-dehydrorhamnose reductase